MSTELSQEQVQNYIKTKKIDILGYQIGEEDVMIQKYFNESKEDFLESFVGTSEGDSHILLDMTEDAQLIQEGIAREMINRIQRARKKV